MKIQPRGFVLFMVLFFIFLIIFVNFYAFFYIFKMSWKKSDFGLQNDNIKIKKKVIKFDSLTLKQKIAQMIIVRGDKYYPEFLELGIGGFFLDRQKTEQDYKQLTKKYKQNSKIEPFISTDLEGAWNPFLNFYQSKTFAEINSTKYAFYLGKNHGRVLRELGFNLDFSPVAEFVDNSYGERVFLGSDKEVQNKIGSYIQGLQGNVFAVCKHYPGKGMIKNLHKISYEQNITSKDLKLFSVCFKNSVDGVMIGHQIVRGEIDSNNLPSTISENVTKTIPENILIFSDEINMNGLLGFYNNKTELYTDLINSGENVILDFKITSEELIKLLEELNKKTKNNQINETKINISVRKILRKKGYKIV